MCFTISHGKKTAGFWKDICTGSYTHVDLDSTEVFGGPGGGIYEGQERDPYRSGLSGTEKELQRDAFLGPGILCLHGRGGWRGDPNLHSESEERGPETGGSDGNVTGLPPFRRTGDPLSIPL